MKNAKNKTTEFKDTNKEGLKSLFEMGPLILFFGVNYFYGIFAGTAVLVISTIISLIISKILYKSIPMLAAFGCIAVVLFGTLTLIFDNDLFIKIKWNKSLNLLNYGLYYTQNLIAYYYRYKYFLFHYTLP